ncbi:uncharacterized protein N7484_002669 [Penicillium longicatenatum]|uniref:uncharacterized protein n=1 Tax=Penicillium longicatenatum TaxID=1561947 RepID=UPI0025484939|nr:uncharacterized protein N7484_002669 [Penicillium longicatenatum]KAJ5648946.1 hypothetical protein N7484_002669 [Penicillium longicatenatum]
MAPWLRWVMGLFVSTDFYTFHTLQYIEKEEAEIGSGMVSPGANCGFQQATDESDWCSAWQSRHRDRGGAGA